MKFWILYLLFAVVGTVGAFFAAPVYRKSLPPVLRDRWAGYAGVISGRGPVEVSGSPAPAAKAASPARGESAEVRPSAPAVASSVAPSVAVAASRQPRSTSAAQSTAAAPSKPAAEGEDELIPSLRGVMPASTSAAKWAVVHTEAPYRNASDGAVAGRAAPGSVFQIDRMLRGERGYELVGTVVNAGLNEPVTISFDRVFCFTGSIDKLSERQRAAFIAYYRARGEAEAIKRAIMSENGKRSPFFADAVAAKEQFDANAAEVVRLENRMRAGISDQKEARKAQERLQKFKNENAVLKDKVRSLSNEHKKWKETHASELKDPESDPTYLRHRREMENYAKAIPGLAF